MRRISKKNSRNRRAFTLVEVIVVLVVLAIIAAMVVPALTGYIKRAKKAKYIQQADAARVAAQAIMAELYGLGPGAHTNGVNLAGQQGAGGSGGDMRWDLDATGGADNEDVDLEWGERVLQLMGRTRDTEPYFVAFGVGHSQGENVSLSDQYTVYYVAYIEDRNSPAIFYANGEWIYEYPGGKYNGIMGANIIRKVGNKKGPNANVLTMGDFVMPLQLYVVSNHTGIRDNFWTSNDTRSLWGHSDSNPNSRWR